ncbi:MAG TPA: DHA2 family efflux MFS transporter permease subunit [Burkholderiales bacterium]|nr:DHA2 family efflux MFS transporter permease subunit [Burkholderiales bacterium]
MSAIAVPAKHPALCSAAVILATVLYSIDWTIASVALPHMRGAFSATQDQISWVITSYIVASAIMIPTAGFMSAKFGRKRVFVAAVGGFTLASMFCGLADSLEMEVIARIVQGMSGAFLIPLSQAIVLDTYPPEDHTRMMGWWGVGSVFGPVIGPALGGYLTEYADWRWIFFINLPFGVLALAGVLAFLPETKADRARKLDWFGFLVLALGIGTLQLMLDRGQRFDWFESPEIILEGALAALGLYLFAVHSLTTRDPFLNPRLLRVPGFLLGLAFVFLYGLLTLPPMVLMPTFMQDLRGMPVDTIGLLQAPRGFGLIVSMFAGGALTHLLGPRLLVGFGFGCLAAAGAEMASWTVDVGEWPIVWTGFVQGVGAGIIWVPLQSIFFASLAPAQRTEAASVLNLVRSLASAIGVSIALTLLTRNSTIARSQMVEHLRPDSAAFRHADLVRGWDLATLDGLAQAQRQVELQAAMIGYSNDFLMLACGALLALPLLLLIPKPGQSAAPVPLHAE